MRKRLPQLIIPTLFACLLLSIDAGAQSNYATPFAFTTLAGSASIGSTDGPGLAARFQTPAAVATDDLGNLYIADSGNCTIRKITPEGVVSTIAGSPGIHGSADGTGSAARFNEPQGIAIDFAGNLYVSDTLNHTIRKITPAGVVTTLAGRTGEAGYVEGTGASARFNAPHGLTVDSAGNVYVADKENNLIRKITPAGSVSTLAGRLRNGSFDPVSEDGVGDGATFFGPADVVVDPAGHVFVAEQSGRKIRRISPDGVVTTLAGASYFGHPSGADGTGSMARFAGPTAIARDAVGNLYVVERFIAAVRKITPDGVVTTLAGQLSRVGDSYGDADGTGAAADFFLPEGIAVNSTGTILVADTYNNTIRKVTAEGEVSTFAGLSYFASSGSADGTGSAARFHGPQGVAVAPSGHLFVVDTYNSTIRQVSLTGEVFTFAGEPGQSGSADGLGGAARFNRPKDLAITGDGTIFVTDPFNHIIRKITLAGEVSTIAGSPGASGDVDGTGSAARFFFLRGVTVDPVGNIYVVDQHAIRKVTAEGLVTTVVGRVNEPGNADGVSAEARFNFPADVAVDAAGNLYVADTNNRAIRKVSPLGLVTTLAGTIGVSGSVDGAGTAARFLAPAGIAVDTTGDLYVTDGEAHTIRRVTAAGVVTTLAGVDRSTGSADGTGSAARFNVPHGIAVDTLGNVYVADVSSNAVRRGRLAGTAPAITNQPQSTTVVRGGTASFTVAASGTGPVTYQWLFNGAPIAGATTATLGIGSVQSSDAGSYTVEVTNAIGSVTSVAATLTVTSAPAPTPAPAQSGGGAPSALFLIGLLAVWAVRWVACVRAPTRAPVSNV